ncbi:uncharacterized protein LOC143367953 [Andrena cerasifolii]|uniref:uncharacterized protein LOC143367953 n=1 Tax=Andrena cerasifolii TaxID=2819439 RepID=UPI004037D9FB
MFYSVELLSFRRKGKLARCWMAATISEKMFKKKCKPASIRKIDVSILCEEILSTIEIRDGRSCGRFSLYLSSQLMYGATKLLFYQTKLFQDYLFEINWTLLEINRHRDEFNVASALDIPDTPQINELFRIVETPTNLHLIAEEPYTSVVEHLMQHEMNFGALTSFEMEKFMLPGPKDSSLNEIRRFAGDQSEEITEGSVQVPLADITNLEFEIPETEKETRAAFARRNKRESLVVVEDQVNKSAPLTPKKRTLKSPAETPTKKSKISAEEMAVPLPPPSPGPILVEPPAEPPAPESALAAALADALESVQAAAPADALESESRQQYPTIEGVEFIEVPRQKRSHRKLFDEQIKLSDNVMQKWLMDIRAHTKEHHPSAVFPSVKEYLSQPSVKILGKSWGFTLTRFYSRHLPRHFIAPNEFSDVPDFEAEQITYETTLRADASSKLPDKTGELSSKLPITSIETTGQLKTIEGMLPIEEFQAKECEEHQRKEIAESLIELPEIIGLEERTEGAIEIPGRRDSDERGPKSSSKSSSSSFNVYLAKAEVLALLEIHWQERYTVTFHDLISSDHYNKMDACCAFQYCLEFYADKVIIMKQAEPFGTIWIEKYPASSSEDSA